MVDSENTKLNDSVYGGDPENAEATEAAEQALANSKPQLDLFGGWDDRAVSVGNA